MRDHFTIIPNGNLEMESIRATNFVNHRFQPKVTENGVWQSNLMVTVQGQPEKRVQFLLPCYFDTSWVSVKAYAKYVDMEVKTCAPLNDKVPSRAMSTKYIALTNGHVYQVTENWQYSCGYAYKCLLTIDEADMSTVLSSLEKETA